MKIIWKMGKMRMKRSETWDFLAVFDMVWWRDANMACGCWCCGKTICRVCFFWKRFGIWSLQIYLLRSQSVKHPFTLESQNWIDGLSLLNSRSRTGHPKKPTQIKSVLCYPYQCESLNPRFSTIFALFVEKHVHFLSFWRSSPTKLWCLAGKSWTTVPQAKIAWPWCLVEVAWRWGDIPAATFVWKRAQ